MLAHTHPPLCGEAEFTALINEMVAEEAPRVFAVVQELGDRADARIAAWGLSFADRAVAYSHRGTMMTLSSADRALFVFERGSRLRPRLVWLPSERAVEGPERTLGEDDQVVADRRHRDGPLGSGFDVEQ